MTLQRLYNRFLPRIPIARDGYYRLFAVRGLDLQRLPDALCDFGDVAQEDDIRFVAHQPGFRHNLNAVRIECDGRVQIFSSFDWFHDCPLE